MRAIAPTLGEIDIPLSLSTITIGVCSPPAWCSASIGDPAGERAVADHGDDLAVLADPFQHPLLQADRVADRGRGVARAHDVVLGLEHRAERGQAVVLADRVEPVARPVSTLCG